MLTTIPPFQVVSHVIKKPPSFSLRGRRLKGKGKGVLCARETRRAREEEERETAFPSFPPSSRAPRAPNPPFPSISNACHAGYQVLACVSSGRKRVRARARQTRVSPSRAPVFSCAHYFQAPATQANQVWTQETHVKAKKKCP